MKKILVMGSNFQVKYIVEGSIEHDYKGSNCVIGQPQDDFFVIFVQKDLTKVCSEMDIVVHIDFFYQSYFV